MKVTEYKNGGTARAVLTGMIVDPAVLGAVSQVWDGSNFGDRWSDIVGSWAVKHWRKYGKAPQRAIENYFDKFCESGRDQDTVDIIEKYLRALSQEYERNGHGPAPEYLKDLAAKHFDIVRYRKLKDELEGGLVTNDLESLDKAYSEFRKVEIGVQAGTHPTGPDTDLTGVIGDREDRSIVKFPDAAGAFFSLMLERDAFIAYMGMEKGKKSFNLLDLAWRAYLQDRRVAWFVVGDMSEAQVKRRLVSRAAGRPVMSDTKVRKPVSIEEGGKDVTFETKSYSGSMTEEETRRALAKHAAKHDPENLWLSVYPRGAITSSGILSLLRERAKDGWLVDICIVDFSDNLGPENTKLEKRHQIDETWGILSAIRQELHCLLVTATQCRREAYGTRTLQRKDVPESKFKLAHVTGMVGINHTDHLDNLGVLALNWVAGRDLDFSEEKLCYIATCLPIANTCVVSTF